MFLKKFRWHEIERKQWNSAICITDTVCISQPYIVDPVQFCQVVTCYITLKYNLNITLLSLDGYRTYYYELYKLYELYGAIMAELYTYYTVLYRKISGLRRRYNTNYIVMTNHTRGPLN